MGVASIHPRADQRPWGSSLRERAGAFCLAGLLTPDTSALNPPIIGWGACYGLGMLTLLCNPEEISVLTTVTCHTPKQQLGKVQAEVAAQRRQLEGCVRVSRAGSRTGVPAEAWRSAGPPGVLRGARFYPEAQRTLHIYKQDPGVTRQVQAGARRPPITGDLKDLWRDAAGILTHTGSGYRTVVS